MKAQHIVNCSDSLSGIDLTASLQCPLDAHSHCELQCTSLAKLSLNEISPNNATAQSGCQECFKWKRWSEIIQQKLMLLEQQLIEKQLKFLAAIQRLHKENNDLTLKLGSISSKGLFFGQNNSQLFDPTKDKFNETLVSENSSKVCLKHLMIPMNEQKVHLNTKNQIGSSHIQFDSSLNADMPSCLKVRQTFSESASDNSNDLIENEKYVCQENNQKKNRNSIEYPSGKKQVKNQNQGEPKTIKKVLNNTNSSFENVTLKKNRPSDVRSTNYCHENTEDGFQSADLCQEDIESERCSKIKHLVPERLAFQNSVLRCYNDAIIKHSQGRKLIRNRV